MWYILSMPKTNKSDFRPHTIKPLKRIGAFIADLVLLMITTISLYSLAINPLLTVITPLTSYANSQEVAFNNCRDILSDSHLVYFDSEGGEIDIEDSFKVEMVHKLKDETLDSKNHFYDTFVHFYAYYLTEEATFNGEKKSFTIAWVNENIYKINDENNVLFSLTGDDINLPLSFSEKAKTELNNYLNGEVNATSQSYYDSYISLMKEKWNDAAELITTSDKYDLNANEYNKYSDKIFAIYSYSSIIFFTIMYFLYYLLLPFLLKKGQTPAKKILHMGVYDENSEPIKFKTLVFRSLIQYLFMFFLVLFVPTMQLGVSVIYLPLISVSGYTFYLLFLAIVLILLTLISGIYMASSLNHQSFHDKMLNTYVMKDNVNLKEELDNRPANVIEQENYDRGSNV